MPGILDGKVASKQDVLESRAARQQASEAGAGPGRPAEGAPKMRLQVKARWHKLQRLAGMSSAPDDQCVWRHGPGGVAAESYGQRETGTL